MHWFQAENNSTTSRRFVDTIVVPNTTDFSLQLNCHSLITFLTKPLLHYDSAVFRVVPHLHCNCRELQMAASEFMTVKMNSLQKVKTR